MKPDLTQNSRNMKQMDNLGSTRNHLPEPSQHTAAPPRRRKRGRPCIAGYVAEICQLAS